MREIEGDVTSVTEGILVHGCNARGVMNAGVAKAVRTQFPQAYRDYMAAFQKGGLRVGQVVWTTVSREPKLAIANGITQEYYGRDPKVRYVDYEGVRRVFEQVAAVARRHQLPVHYPRIGASLGNGDWAILSRIIEETLEGVDHRLWTGTDAKSSLITERLRRPKL